MAIEAAFKNLRHQLRTLQEKVGVLDLNVEGDFPTPGLDANSGGSKARAKELPPPPVVALADRVTAMVSAVDEAIFAAEEGVRAYRDPRRLPETQRELITVQRCLNQALEIFVEDIAAYDAVETLKSMARRLHLKARKDGAIAGTKKSLGEIARESGGTWPQWVWVVKKAIDDCRLPLHASFKALAECWQEVAEKLPAGAISVQSTNIGQHVERGESSLDLIGQTT
jgi:hypothetical protein